MLYLKQILFDEKTEFHHKKLEQTTIMATIQEEEKIIGGTYLYYTVYWAATATSTSRKKLFLEDLEYLFIQTNDDMLKEQKLDNSNIDIGDVSQMNDNKIRLVKQQKR